MSTSEPTRNKWDLALDGIEELGQKIDGLGDQLESTANKLDSRQDYLEAQIVDVRRTTMQYAPVGVLRAVEDRFDTRLTVAESRVTALENGVAARILAHMEAEKQERQDRQKVQD